MLLSLNNYATTAEIWIGYGDSIWPGRDVARDGIDIDFANCLQYRASHAPIGISATIQPYDNMEISLGDFVSPGTRFQYERNVATGLPIYVIPLGQGGSTAAPGWAVGSTNLNNAISRANSAIAAIIAAIPGARLMGFIQILGTNDINAQNSAALFKTTNLATIAAFKAGVFMNGVSGITADALPITYIFAGALPECRGANYPYGNPIEEAIQEIAATVSNGKYCSWPYGIALGDNLHPTAAGAYAMGETMAAAVVNTISPVISNVPTTYSLYNGQNLNFEIIMDMPAWPTISGPDAASFEIVATNLINSATPNYPGGTYKYSVQIAGGGTLAVGTYNFTINAQGTAPTPGVQNTTLTVLPAYGTQVETIVEQFSYAVQNDGSYDGFGNLVISNLVLKRGVNLVCCCTNIGAGSHTSFVTSNGLIGVPDVNNSGLNSVWYVYSAQDQTAQGTLGLSVGFNASSTFVEVISLVGTVASQSSSSLSTLGTSNPNHTTSLSCPSDGIIVGAGFSTNVSAGNYGAVAGMTAIEQPGGATTLCYAGSRITDGAIGTDLGGFGQVSAAAFAKA